MTDGANSRLPVYPEHDNSDVNAANDLTAKLCKNIENKGIEIFTIAFEVMDTTIEDLLQECATPGGAFYDATEGEKLKAAFDDIGGSLVQFRLAKQTGLLSNRLHTTARRIRARHAMSNVTVKQPSRAKTPRGSGPADWTLPIGAGLTPVSRAGSCGCRRGPPRRQARRVSRCRRGSRSRPRRSCAGCGA